MNLPARPGTTRSLARPGRPEVVAGPGAVCSRRARSGAGQRGRGPRGAGLAARAGL